MKESVNKDLEKIKNKKIDTKSTITEIKNTLEGINSRIPETEQICDLKHKMVERNAEEQNKVKRMKITEDSFRDLQYNIKCTNNQIIRIQKKKRKRKTLRTF